MMYSQEQGLEAVNPKAFGKVAVLLGGCSAEREVSLASGSRVFEALQRSGVDCCLIDPVEGLVSQLAEQKPDRVLIALHGPRGEDGTVQGLLDQMDIPYAGSDIMSSALAMDKYRSKLLWQAVGLPTPDFMLIEHEASLECCAEILPAFVKPSLEGSSVGVTRVDREQDLFPAWEQASEYGGSVLVEKFVEGPEFTVAILNGQPLPAIRIESAESFYDYDAKYVTGNTQYHLPCGLSQSKEQELQALALTAFETLGCSGWGRVDFMQDERGRFWLLEANTVPGMTETSLVPMAAKAVGLDFEALVLEILKSSLSPARQKGAALKGSKELVQEESEAH
ncbi:D-alanine--D-alanine ligase [Endozoicomonas arenosclerae]|uniref:D-alanine--D-alanine ligase n=1 Tax=Endozoicomonas arenosclerae TaxID=1633495 RepID=UPI0009A19027|nr:D-alanine--D-alanine ligase [Endozoicomonas arenosclerae]